MHARRQLLVLGVASALAPRISFGQPQAKSARVGFLYFGSRSSAVETGRYAAFLEGMRELGYVEGRDYGL